MIILYPRSDLFVSDWYCLSVLSYHLLAVPLATLSYADTQHDVPSWRHNPTIIEPEYEHNNKNCVNKPKS